MSPFLQLFVPNSSANSYITLSGAELLISDEKITQCKGSDRGREEVRSP